MIWGLILIVIGGAVLGIVNVTQSLVGPGGCQLDPTYGPVASIRVTETPIQQGYLETASGTIGGACSTMGNVYWWITASGSSTHVLSGQSTGSTAENTFGFTFDAPNVANGQTTQSFVLTASMCPYQQTCSSVITGTQSVDFVSTTQTTVQSETATYTFTDSVTHQPVQGVLVTLYSGSKASGTPLVSQEPTSELGTISWSSLPVGTYSIAYNPGPASQGGYPSGTQTFTVSSSGSNTYSVGLVAATMSSTSTTSSHSVTITTMTSTSTKSTGPGGSSSAKEAYDIFGVLLIVMGVVFTGFGYVSNRKEGS